MGCDRLPSSLCNLSFPCKQQTTNKPFGTLKAATVFIFSLMVTVINLIVNVLVTIPLFEIFGVAFWALSYDLAILKSIFRFLIRLLSVGFCWGRSVVLVVALFG